jgi:polyketide cyclase/dehydrase/lipid transport protein
MTTNDTEALAQSNDMQPVTGTIDIDVPIDVLWKCFAKANLWPRWNECMFWVLNRNLALGQQLIWAFEPMKWWYLYKLPGVAKLVEVEPRRKVTWEITVLPDFYARHTYFIEDLGHGRSRFGSWEKAMGPTFRTLQSFWVAHFVFVKDESLRGAQRLEEVYRRTGNLDESNLPQKNYLPTIIAAIIVMNIVFNVRTWLRRFTRHG